MLELSNFTSIGFDTEEIAPQVFVTQNFLTPEDLNDLWLKINSVEDEDWTVVYLRNLRAMAKVSFGTDDLEQLRAEGKLELTTDWADKVLALDNDELRNRLVARLQPLIDQHTQYINAGFPNIQRQYEGAILKAHVDQHGDPLIAYAAVAYINDDYTDGELYFPGQELTLKPKAGSLVIFPGIEDYEHGVRSPGPGPIRYVIPSFITYNDPKYIKATDKPVYRYDLM